MLSALLDTTATRNLLTFNALELAKMDAKYCRNVMLEKKKKCLIAQSIITFDLNSKGSWIRQKGGALLSLGS
jgi:hypothetical protein